MGSFLWIIGWKKGVIAANIKVMGLGDYSYLRFYRNVSEDLITFCLGRPISPIELSPESQECFEKLKEEGGVLLTAHYHNWELMGGWLVKNGLKLKCLAQGMNNSFWNKRLAQFRAGINLPVIFNSPFSVGADWIKTGGTFGILWDQHSKNSNIGSYFFDQPVSMTKLPYLLLKRLGCKVYFFHLNSKMEVCIQRITPESDSKNHPFNDEKGSTITSEPEFTAASKLVAPTNPKGSYVKMAGIQTGGDKTTEHFTKPTLPKSYSELPRSYNLCLEKIIWESPELYYGLAHKKFKKSVKY